MAFYIWLFIKLGISTSIKNRDSVYNTGEVTRGNYIMIIEIPHITPKTRKMRKCT